MQDLAQAAATEPLQLRWQKVLQKAGMHTAGEKWRGTAWAKACWTGRCKSVKQVRQAVQREAPAAAQIKQSAAALCSSHKV